MDYLRISLYKGVELSKLGDIEPLSVSSTYAKHMPSKLIRIEAAEDKFVSFINRLSSMLDDESLPCYTIKDEHTNNLITCGPATVFSWDDIDNYYFHQKEESYA